MDLPQQLALIHVGCNARQVEVMVHQLAPQLLHGFNLVLILDGSGFAAWQNMCESVSE